MRLFFAIRIPEQELTSWPKAQSHLKKDIKTREFDAKWTLSDNYHVTLQFLGDTEEDKIPLLQNTLLNLAKNYPTFNLLISGLDAFSDVLHARVLYLRVQNKKILRSLQNELAQNLKDQGFISESPEYIPHLTILRFRNPHAVKDLISPFQRKTWGKVHIKELVLFKSEMKGIYPIYTPIFSAPLSSTLETEALDSNLES